MHLKLPHKFTKSEALQRVKQMLEQGRTQLAEKVTIQEERWENDILHFAFTAEGQSISGQLTVEDHDYIIDAKLPLMLKLFEGKIEKMIQEQAAKALG